jgi:hypothetical protein
VARVLEARGFRVSNDLGAECDVVWIRESANALETIGAIRDTGFTGSILLASPSAIWRLRLKQAVSFAFPASLRTVEAAILSALPIYRRLERVFRDPSQLGIDEDALAVLLTNVERRIAKPILAAHGATVIRSVIEQGAFGLCADTPEARLKRARLLDVHMTRVRRKLALFGIEIVTVRRTGFRARIVSA